MDEDFDATLPMEGGTRKEFEDALVLLGSIRSTLADLLRRATDGDLGALAELGKKHAQLEGAVKQAFETEKKYNEWVARQTGTLRGGELDLAEARAQIGCRLARLRACCREG